MGEEIKELERYIDKLTYGKENFEELLHQIVMNQVRESGVDPEENSGLIKELEEGFLREYGTEYAEKIKRCLSESKELKRDLINLQFQIHKYEISLN